MTSLIDVIFLLLLFFMLSSTFSKHAEVELAAGGGAPSARDVPPLFIQLTAEHLTVNGQIHHLMELSDSPLASAVPGAVVLISLRDGVDAQRLTDALVVLREFPNISLSVLGA